MPKAVHLAWSLSGLPPAADRAGGPDCGAAKKKEAACSSRAAQRPHQMTKPRGRAARKEKIIGAALI
ncbi:hypothetical protein NDU88_001236 [Pleurodeles waltl]|uniref:Uncharacterized protein n=1 Tax=Pleurodeles waltl TaxID=8319 RepID=A0AAV7USS7_PLEWA|nr:hypothetical protein NDU88_001236 [Pleurodeles waltl]